MSSILSVRECRITFYKSQTWIWTKSAPNALRNCDQDFSLLSPVRINLFLYLSVPVWYTLTGSGELTRMEGTHPAMGSVQRRQSRPNSVIPLSILIAPSHENTMYERWVHHSVLQNCRRGCWDRQLFCDNFRPLQDCDGTCRFQVRINIWVGLSYLVNGPWAL